MAVNICRRDQTEIFISYILKEIVVKKYTLTT